MTADGDAVEPCDHHLDCLPGESPARNQLLGLLSLGSQPCHVCVEGSCCDLRLHECKLYNRGLNNKCYDDCMCEEGE